MGDDIRRYLAGEALEAGPESTIYRFKKTLRKHKGLFIAAAIVFLVLVVGIITTTTESIRANKQAARAEQEKTRAVSAAKSEANQRLVADKALEEAKAANVVAEQAVEGLVEGMTIAFQQAYSGNIHAAFAAINQDEQASARRRLNSARDSFALYKDILNTKTVGGLDSPFALPLDHLPFEWRYLHAKNDDSLAVLKGHKNSVNSVALSPDGSRIVSGSGDSTVRLWDVASGEELAVLKDRTRIGSTVMSVAFSPDGLRVVLGGYGTVSIWDTAIGKELAVLKGHEDSVYSVAFSPDGSRIVSGSLDKTVRLWDVASGEELALLKGHEDGVISVDFSPDGSRIVSGSWDNTVRLWDVASGEELALFKGHESNGEFCRLQPRWIAYCFRFLEIEQFACGMQQAEKNSLVLKGHESNVMSVAFSPDGSRIVSGSVDSTVRLWDVASGEELAVLKGHEGSVMSVAFSPDGSRIVSGSWDNTVRLWDAASGEELAVLTGHESNVISVDLQPRWIAYCFRFLG